MQKNNKIIKNGKEKITEKMHDDTHQSFNHSTINWVLGQSHFGKLRESLLIKTNYCCEKILCRDVCVGVFECALTVNAFV